MRRLLVLAVALFAVGCSSHSGVAPAPTTISPQIFQKHVNKIGWVVTPIPPIQGHSAYAVAFAVGANHKVWATVIASGTSVGELAEIRMDGRVKTFPLSISPGGIALGADQNLWVTTLAGVVARVTPQGQETDFAVAPSNINLGNIISGPDGALWFTGCSHDESAGGIGRVDTSGVSTFYPLGCRSVIASGPDGNIWFGDLGVNIYSMTTQGTLVGTYFVGDEFLFWGLTAGSDGAMYAVSTAPPVGDRELVRVSTSGTVTHLGNDLENDPISALILGPDGNLWIAAPRDSSSYLVTFDPGTQSFDQRVRGPRQAGGPLLLGPDGNIWASDARTSSVDTYIIQAMTVTPKQLTISVGHHAGISVTETNYSGGWTAVATNPTIAGVTPKSQSGTFEVTGVAPGTTSVTVYDTMYNSIAVKVSVR